nr:hypothetical transcript [Hymenolepis microstoma]
MDIAAWIEEVKNHFSFEEHRWYIFAPLCAMVAYKVIRHCYREYQLPPGPTGWPWLGYTPCLKQGAFKDVQSVCKKYGPVTSFRVCGKLMIILSDEDTIKEAALKNRALISRYTMLSSHSLARGHGLFNYDGDNASSLRHVLVRGIHQLMHDKSEHQGGSIGTRLDSVLDEILDHECDKFNNYLRSMEGKPFKVTLPFRRFMWHIIWRSSFGMECPLDEDTINGFAQSVGYINANIGPFQYKQMLPHLLTGLVRNCEIIRRMLGADELWDRYQKAISAIKQTVAGLWSSPDRNEDCLLSYFMNDKEHKISQADASQLLLEVLAAGVDTTALSMVWCCYGLASGKLDIKPGEKFTESKLEEVHRLASVVPMALPHIAKFDSYVKGYLIPKNSIVIFNLFSVHQAQLRKLASANSSDACPVAHKSSSKPKLYYCESALPFSVGARACPGFMFATHMLMRTVSKLTSEFKVVEGENDKNAPELQLNGITRPQRDDSYRFLAIN